jgi:sialate O-acetylesterase
MDLPGNWETRGLDDFDGCVWYYKTVSLPREWTQKDLVLELGPIDDMDVVWFNEKRIGQTLDLGRWTQPRRYTVPASIVREGTNSIAVRVLDPGGEGGFRGEPDQMKIQPADDGGAKSLPLSRKEPAHPDGSLQRNDRSPRPVRDPRSRLVPG